MSKAITAVYWLKKRDRKKKKKQRERDGEGEVLRGLMSFIC